MECCFCLLLTVCLSVNIFVCLCLSMRLSLHLSDRSHAAPRLGLCLSGCRCNRSPSRSWHLSHHRARRHRPLLSTFTPTSHSIGLCLLVSSSLWTRTDSWVGDWVAARTDSSLRDLLAPASCSRNQFSEQRRLCGSAQNRSYLLIGLTSIRRDI